MSGLRIVPGRARRPLGDRDDRLRRLRVGMRLDDRVAARRPHSRSIGSSGTCPSSGTPSSARERRAAAGAEELLAGADEPRHVLDDADRRACRSSAPSAPRGSRPAARPAAASSRAAPRRAAAAARARSRRRRFRAACRRRACPARPSGRRRGTARARGGASARATSPARCRRGRSRSRSASGRRARAARSSCRRRPGAGGRRASAAASGRRRPRRAGRRAGRARPARPRYSTVSDDLPTPPLPDAMATTRVVGSSEISRSARPPRGASRAPPSPPGSSRRTRARPTSTPGDARRPPCRPAPGTSGAAGSRRQ